MKSIELTDEEVATLKKALESYLSEASFEISNTENFEMRKGLKEERDRLKKICDSLA